MNERKEGEWEERGREKDDGGKRKGKEERGREEDDGGKRREGRRKEVNI